MDIKNNLAEFKKEVDKEIKLFLDAKIKEYSPKDKLIGEALEKVKKNIMSGGKRLRPAVMYYGYIGSGGDDKRKMLKTCISVEIIHAFLLVHDDIMDRDIMRHGEDTINYSYEKMGKRFFPKEDSLHFGNSMALIIGDMIAAFGNQVLFNSNFEPDLVIKALSKLQDIVAFTIVGQAKDFYMGYRKKATMKEVLEIYEYKTARYTFEGPLHLGGILGGASKDILDGFSNFSIPLGMAFQIQDDILGIFGTEKKIGKLVGSDIREGKQTVLLLKAIEKGSLSDRKKIQALIANKNLTSRDIKNFQEIVIRTGSLDFAKNLMQELIQKSQKEINKLKIKNESKEFFLGLAEYISTRET